MTTDASTNATPNGQTIAAAAAVGTLGVVAYVSYLLFEVPAFGIAAGAAVGAGTYFHLPYFLQLEEDRPAGDAWHDVHVGAAGLALEAWGVGAIALAFLVGPGAVALAGGLALALASYVVLSTVLPGRLEDDGASA